MAVLTWQGYNGDLAAGTVLHDKGGMTASGTFGAMI